MLTLYYRNQRSLLQYYARQSLELSRDIADDSLEPLERDLSDLIEQVDQERRVLVLGRAKSGKSSLLASLIEEPVIAQVKIDDTHLLWRTRESEDNSPARYLVRDDINDLAFIDTADLAAQAVQDSMPTLCERADSVIFCLDARVAEDEFFWRSLNEVKQSYPRAGCLLVVTYADLLSAEQMLRLKDMLRDQMRKHLAEGIGYYLIASHDLLAIKSVRRQVQEGLDGKHGLLADLEQLSEACRRLLQKQSSILRLRSSARRHDTDFMRAIDTEISHFQERQRAGVNGLCESYLNDLAELRLDLTQWVKKSLLHFLSPVKLLSLLRLDLTLDNRLWDLLKLRLRDRQLESDHQFILACTQHWHSVGERMKETLHYDIGQFQTSEVEQFLRQRRGRMVSPLYTHISEERYRHKLRGLFLPIAYKLYPLFVLICACIGIAGFMGANDYHVIAVIFFVVSIILWLVASMVQYFAIKKANAKLDTLTESLVQSMQPKLHRELEQLVLNRVATYRHLYTHVRQRLIHHEEMLMPLSDKQSHIYHKFSLLQSDLQSLLQR